MVVSAEARAGCWPEQGAQAIGSMQARVHVEAMVSIEVPAATAPIEQQAAQRLVHLVRVGVRVRVRVGVRVGVRVKVRVRVSSFHTLVSVFLSRCASLGLG